jgi:hypothetical protein
MPILLINVATVHGFQSCSHLVQSCMPAASSRHRKQSRAEPALVRLALASRSGDDSLLIGYLLSDLSHTQQLRLVLRQMAFQRRGY